MRLELTVSLPHEGRSVPIARHVVRATMATLGVAQTCVEDVEVALSEACTNVLQHAEAADAYDVRLQVDDDRCLLRVVDVGEAPGHLGMRMPVESPGEPPGAEVEHGRGLLLMRALVDRVGFVEVEEHGTVVSLEKRLVFKELPA
jgi:serine/threonine-protein kinase RsbW